MPLNLIVEADSATEADERAERAGAYFNGCESGMDCECCGDRWSRAYGAGTAEPTIYGRPWKKHCADPEHTDRYWGHLVARVVYRNGSSEEM